MFCLCVSVLIQKREKKESGPKLALESDVETEPCSKICF